MPSLSACGKQFSHQRSATEELCYDCSHDRCAADSKKKKRNQIAVLTRDEIVRCVHKMHIQDSRCLLILL
jgi:hypothetical protein